MRIGSSAAIPLSRQADANFKLVSDKRLVMPRHGVAIEIAGAPLPAREHARELPVGSTSRVCLLAPSRRRAAHGPGPGSTAITREQAGQGALVRIRIRDDVRSEPPLESALHTRVVGREDYPDTRRCVDLARHVRLENLRGASVLRQERLDLTGPPALGRDIVGVSDVETRPFRESVRACEFVDRDPA